MASNDNASSCAFTYSDGRQCRMLRSSRKSQFCFHHERKLRHLKESDDAANDLFDPISSGFVTATALSQSVFRAFLRPWPRAASTPSRPRRSSASPKSFSRRLLRPPPNFVAAFEESYWHQLVRLSCGNLPEYVAPVAPTRKAGNSNSQKSQTPKPPNPKLPDTIDEFLQKVGIAAD